MNIKYPTLLLDSARCKANISFMRKRAARFGVAFKPHFKTHQSKIIGDWFKEEGVTGITVSSIKMAEYFAAAGWKDITIAFPANVVAADKLNLLAEKIDLTVLVDNTDTVGLLDSKISNTINVLVELDAGSRRTGINTDNLELITEVVAELKRSSNLQFQGFYSHFGHTYGCRGEEEVKNVFQQSLDNINRMMQKNDYNNVALHIGDTPGCSLAEDFTGITAITPGNFVFYDIMQQNIGSCRSGKIAVAMACPIVSKNADRKEVCIHGGAVHFSKDNIAIDGNPAFGQLVNLQENSIGELMPDAKIIAVSQEHGIIRVTDQLFREINIGDVVGVLPIHSCLTAECMGAYTDFEGSVIDHL